MKKFFFLYWLSKAVKQPWKLWPNSCHYPLINYFTDKIDVECREHFDSEFLQKVTILANQTLLMRQGNKDVENIITPYSDSEESRTHHFPDDIGRTPIGINMNTINFIIKGHLTTTWTKFYSILIPFPLFLSTYLVIESFLLKFVICNQFEFTFPKSSLVPKRLVSQSIITHRACISTGARHPWNFRTSRSAPENFEVLCTNWHKQALFYRRDGTHVIKFLTQGLSLNNAMS